MYEVYSFPNCEKCHHVTDMFKQRGICYQEFNAGIGDGRKKLNDFYRANKDAIKRDESGAIILPIVTYHSDSQSNSSIKIHQGESGLEDFIKKNEAA